jgi:hypothetical protein
MQSRVNDMISATQTMAYTRQSMRPGFQTSLAIGFAADGSPEIIRDSSLRSE